MSKVAPPAGLPPTVQALWWAAKGDWDKAHKIVQDDESREAAWVHAYLHRVEGDLPNARLLSIVRPISPPRLARSTMNGTRSLPRYFAVVPDATGGMSASPLIFFSPPSSPPVRMKNAAATAKMPPRMRPIPPFDPFS